MNKLLSFTLLISISSYGCGSCSGDGVNSNAVDSGESDSGESDSGESDAAADSGGPDDAGNYAPSCAITGPLNGTTQNYDDDFAFIVSATDTEDGALSGASVVLRSSLVVAPLGSGVSVTATLNPGVHVVTCTATDSLGRTGTGSITVTSRSPYARINHPGNGEVRPVASSIPFVGVGNDFEDGSLTGASLVWTSNLDGQFGTGTSFNSLLSAGTQVVTLTVTDSNANTSTDSITFTVTP